MWKKIRPSCIFLAQRSIYKRNFDENRLIHLLIKEEKIFLKYIEILEKVSNIIKREFNSELIYSKKYLKAKKETKKKVFNVNMDQ